MPLSQALVEQLTPEEPAPETLDDGGKDRKRRAVGRTPHERRLAWTRYLRETDFFRLPKPKEINRFRHAWHVGVGLIPTQGFEISGPKYMADAIKEAQYTWGIIILVNAYEETAILESTLDFGRLRFPVIVSPTEIEMHNLTLNSTHNSAVGSRTTWASARATLGSPACPEGLLTARHVLDRCGQKSFWSPATGSHFSVHRRASSYIDAAYLSGSWGTVSPSKKSARLISNMSTGDPYTMDGAYTNRSGTITHLPHAKYRGGGTAAHIFLDQTGQPGDSGALIHEGDDPISMYLAKAKLKDGTEEGVSLALEQVSHDLDVDIYI